MNMFSTACLWKMLLSDNMVLLFIFTSCPNMISLGRKTEGKAWGLQLQLMEMWESTGYVERRKKERYRDRWRLIGEWWKSASVLPEMAVRKASDGTWKRGREKRVMLEYRKIWQPIIISVPSLASCLEVLAYISSMLTIMVPYQVNFL